MGFQIKKRGAMYAISDRVYMGDPLNNAATAKCLVNIDWIYVRMSRTAISAFTIYDGDFLFTIRSLELYDIFIMDF